MFGYATNETDELMPLPIIMAHKLTRKLAEVRKSGEIGWIRPDGKSQVSVQYKDGRPESIIAIVVSTQHAPNITSDEIEKTITEKVIKPVCGTNIFISSFHHLPQTGFITFINNDLPTSQSSISMWTTNLKFSCRVYKYFYLITIYRKQVLSLFQLWFSLSHHL